MIRNQIGGWLKKLGEKLGLGAYFPWNDIEEYLDTRLKLSWTFT